MPEKEISDFLQKKLDLLQRERDALALKLSQTTGQVRDIDIVMRTIKSWKEKPSIDGTELLPTLRDCIKQKLQETSFGEFSFTGSEFVRYIQAILPSALSNSIMAELSKAVERGEAIKLETGKYQAARSDR